jgi:hypothetical protein
MTVTGPIRRIFLAIVLALAATPLAFAVGSGGTGLRVYAQGALGTSGGVVVNGITYDPTNARITINGRDGRGADELRPGMIAGVDGYVIPGLNVGVASSIQVSRVAFGKVAMVGSGGTGLKVAGIYVTPRTDVVTYGCPALSSITVGATVDVYGYSDGVSGVVNATRIECIAPSDALRLHGVASSVTEGTIVVNGVLIDVSGAQFVGFAAPIATGDRVEVEGTASAGGIVAATVTFAPDIEVPNGEDTEVEDAISAIISPSAFIIDAFQVDATNAKFSGGTAANLAVGRVVHVQGTVVNGILHAKSVGFDDDESDDSQGYTATANGGAELDELAGTIASIPSATSLVVNNVTVLIGAATFLNGDRTGLAVGKSVDVLGKRTGAGMKAVQVKFTGGHSTLLNDGKLPAGATAGGAQVIGPVAAVITQGLFQVGGVKVDAHAAKLTGGSLQQIQSGTHIRATGTFRTGVLIAAQVVIGD